MPTTVFTFCDFPGNDSYGVSDVSVLVLCSKFLNFILSNVLLNLPFMSKTRFNDAPASFYACCTDQARNHAVCFVPFLDF